MASSHAATQPRGLTFGLVLLSLVVACERPTPTDGAPPVTESSQTAAAPAPEEPVAIEAPAPAVKPTDAVGVTSREQIEGEYEGWAMDDVPQPDEAAAKALATVPPGATVDVYLGTWCGDSRREVRRFWRALDLAGDIPFEVNTIGLDRDFSAGDVSLEGKDIVAVPTFVVSRDGVEVGRIIERSPVGVEVHLVELLNGTRTGTISATRP